VLINEVTHGAKMRGVFGQCRGDSCFECVRAVAAEQLQQTPGEHTQMDAAFGGAQEQRLRTGCGVMQAVLRAMRPGSAFVSDESLDMGGIFDLRAAVEAARVGGDHGLTIEDAHGVDASQHGQGAVHVHVRDGVIV
jgi:hypothetical protein